MPEPARPTSALPRDLTDVLPKGQTVLNAMKAHFRSHSPPEMPMLLISELEAALHEDAVKLDAAAKDSHILRACNIVEIAVANDTGSVSEYMEHWEGRTIKAESRVAELNRENETLEAEVVRLTRERDEFKALASVGTWHKDCRPNRRKAAEEIQKSQQRIDALAGEVAKLTAQRAAPPAVAPPPDTTP